MKKLYVEQKGFKELQNDFLNYLEQVEDIQHLNEIVSGNIQNYCEVNSECE
jgi:hypothetical protein